MNPDKIINVIKVGYLGTEEVLVVADDKGEVCVWFTMDLQRDPLLLNVAQSAWGIAIHAEQRLIAVSCNAFTVTVFHCGIDSRPSHTALSTDTPDETPLTGRTSQQILTGHGHNVPNISFSPCGNFIASTSVDMTCRTWRVSDGVQVQQKSLQGLWGWGVSFVDRDSWMTLTRSDYKKIPKDHLRPGKFPGQSVKDSPLPSAVSSQRPFGRDLRDIRSRWFAGPLHNTSCDEFETNEDEDNERRRAMDGGEWAEHNDDMDDRDAALFGMDDDEGEDEWEDLSSSDDEIEDDEDSIISEQPSGTSHPQDEEEEDASADTGDDGDNEGTGVDTEDGGGFTTEDGSTRPTKSRGIKTDMLRRSTVVPLVRASARHESSSEQEQLTTASSRSMEADSVTVSEAENVADNTMWSDKYKRGNENQEMDSEQDEHEVNLDPSYFINLQPNVENTFNHHHSWRSRIPKAQSPTSISPSEDRHQNLPQCPTELLLCATARNIYILSQNPLPPRPEIPQPLRPESPHSMYSRELHISASLLSSLFSSGHTSLPLTELISLSASGQAPWIIQPEGSIESLSDAEGDHNNSLQAMMEIAAHAEYLEMQEELAEEMELEGEYDTEYDTDPNYEDMDEYMIAADEEQEVDSGESSDDEDVTHFEEDDSNDQYEDAQDGMEDSSNHSISSDNSQNTSILPLHTISVARAATARVDDSRRYHYSEHYDRLFVMLMVPELSVLITASQKGSVTIFRLLRVVDDELMSSAVGATPSTLPNPSAPSDLSELNTKSPETQDQAEDTNKGKEQSTAPSSAVPQPDSVTIHGVQYVLFPEIYLPRFDPPLHPLIGVSVVPVQKSEVLPPAFLSQTEAESFSGGSNNSGGVADSTSMPSNPSSSASFILHLAYLDSQFYSYEIRLRNEKDDPIALSSIFV
ncbi:hypothetical protein BGZ76_010702 [Entomortierella beljakovae]|nr:hypothetical protein BGZ76_010702 [Entomortierella beljakovae]